MNVDGVTKPAIDVVIVNWNSTEQLGLCLGSIADSDRESIDLGRIVVIDNASREFFIEDKHRESLPLEVIENTRNIGFAAACNQGAKICSSDHVLFLNPDVELGRDSLAMSVGWLATTDGGIGICGIRLLNDDGRCETSCADFPNLKMYIGTALGLARWLPRHFPSRFHSACRLERSGVVDQVSGAFFLVKKALFDRIGGFDERFFVYYEEVDLSLRAKKAGFHSYYLAEAVASHIGGTSTGQAGPRRLFYYLQSRLKYAKKNFEPLSYLLLLQFTLGVEFVLRSLRALGRKDEDLRSTLTAFGMLWAWLMKEGTGTRDL